MIHWLNQQEWYGWGANVIQYTTVIGWGFLMWHIWSRRCGEPFCIRPGEVPHPGRHHKLCKKHARKHDVTH